MYATRGREEVGFNSKVLLDSAPITKAQREHLKQVYFLLTGMIAISTVGVALNMVSHYGGILTGLLSAVGAAVVMISKDMDQTQRKMLAGGVCFLMGLTLSPLIEAIMFVDSSIVLNAFFATCVIFASFSAGAVYSNGSRMLLYVLSIMGSIVALSTSLLLINLFLWSYDIMIIRLYLGLVLFSLYVVCDTQLILAKVAMGDKDVLGHAMFLFGDFMRLFVRVLIVLARNANDNRNERNRGNR